MYQVGVRTPMDVGHFLVGDFDEESLPHRHDYEVEWRCSVESLDENGFSVDISVMKRCLDSLAEEMGGSMLNDIGFFASRQTSIENFAEYVWHRLTEALQTEAPNDLERIVTSEIRVWEAPDAWASYRQPIRR